MNGNQHNSTLHTAYEQAFKENESLKEVLAEFAKAARGTIAKHGMWQQEFNGNEVLAAIALLDATKGVLSQKETALGMAVQFIGMLEDNEVWGDTAKEYLERINQTLIARPVSVEQDNKDNEFKQPSGIIL